LHRLIIGKINPKPIRNLLGAPRSSPPTVLPTAVSSSDPAHLWARYGRAVWSNDFASKTILYIPPQLIVRSELRDLRALGTLVGVPLGGRGAVVQVAAARCGVPA